MLSSSTGSSSYALELQALKAELRLTLARLGDVGSRPSSASSDAEPGAAPWSVASTRTVPSTDRSTPSLSHAVAPPPPPASTSVAARNQQQLVQELRRAAQRRRELEAELAREQRRVTQAPWQSAIAALRRQRAEIAREMEAERRRDAFAGGDREKRVLLRDSATQMTPPPPTRRSTQVAVVGSAETQFAIGGVVTLEPIAGGEQRSAAAPVAAQTQPRAADTGLSAALEREVRSRRLPMSQLQHQRQLHSHHSHHHHDALNEVFSIQLKFAETMLKLEKSVQVREQLLQRSNAPPTRGRYGARRRARGSRSGQQLTSDAESFDGDDVSNDYDSFSSGASLGEYAVRLRRNTSDSDDDVLVSGGRARDVATAAASSRADAVARPPPPGSQANQVSLPVAEAEERGATTSERSVGVAGASPASSLEPRTPSTENSVKTTSSLETKKVRFGDEADEYATPLIAKKFTFENQSDDDDGDAGDLRDRAAGDDDESALSFMGGSSVASSELNDVSLVKAFQAFRLELGMLKAASPQLFSTRSAPSGISAAISAARKLFVDGKPDSGDDGRRTVVAVDSSTAASHPSGGEQLLSTRHHEVGELDRASLRERRRQICLDIQDASAQLVLTFGSRNAHETERIKQTLIELRRQLRTIDEHLAQ